MQYQIHSGVLQLSYIIAHLVEIIDEHIQPKDLSISHLEQLQEARETLQQVQALKEGVVIGEVGDFRH